MAVALTIMMVVLCMVVQTQSVADFVDQETTLYRELFINSNYTARFRPEKQTKIGFAISLATIVEVNEKEGYITTTVIPKMSWKDPRLTWDKEAIIVEHLQIPVDDIWTPDLEVLNRFKDTAHDLSMRPMVWLHYDGTIYFVPRRTYQTPCSFDLDKFPYDKQTCMIILGSWAYLQTEVDFTMSENNSDLNFYVGHSDFSVTSFHVNRTESHYGEAGIPFVELIITIELSRRTKFFYYLYMLPADILLFTLPLIHLIPPNRDGKLQLVGAIFICVVLMMNMLADFMPGYYSDSPPKALRLYFACLLSTFMSAVVSCVTMSLSNTDSKTSRVPLILQKLVLRRAGKFCCVSLNPGGGQDYRLLNLQRMLPDSDAAEPRVPEEGEMMTAHHQNRENGSTDVLGSSDARPGHSAESQAVAAALQQLVTELQLARYREQVKVEWVKLAQIFDRLAATIFSISALCLLGMNHYS